MGAFTIVFVMSVSFIVFGFFASYIAFKKQLNEKGIYKSLKIFTTIFILSVINNRTIQESINLRKQKAETHTEISETINKNEFDFKYNNSFDFNIKAGEKNDNNN